MNASLSKSFFMPLLQSFPLSSLHIFPFYKQALIYFLSPYFCLEFYINTTIHFLFSYFFIWNTSFDIHQYMSAVPCFLLLMVHHFTVRPHLFILHPLMDVWISRFWVLEIKFLWTFVYKSLHEHMSWVSS